MNKLLVDNFLNILKENYDLIKIKYSREIDIEYAFIIDEISTGTPLLFLQRGLMFF